jgi:hypothetical protein
VAESVRAKPELAPSAAFGSARISNGAFRAQAERFRVSLPGLAVGLNEKLGAFSSSSAGLPGGLNVKRGFAASSSVELGVKLNAKLPTVTPSSRARFASPSAVSDAVLASSGGFIDDFAFVLSKVCEKKKGEGLASVRGSVYPNALPAASHERNEPNWKSPLIERRRPPHRWSE